MALVRQVMADAAETAAQQTHSTAAANTVIAADSCANIPSSSSSSGSYEAACSNGTPPPGKANLNGSSSGSSSGSSGRILLRAVLEVASIVPSNGSLAILNSGFSLGAWTAVLSSHGFDVTTIHVKSWKKDYGLLGRDKDSSRDLARQLYQQAGVPQDQLLR